MGAENIANDEKLKKAVSIIRDHMRVTPVRLPKRIEKVSLRWLRAAPFFSEFLLRFNYFITKQIPTMGVNCTGARINLYINEQFMNGGGERVKFDPKTKQPLFKQDKQGNPELDKDGKIQFEMEPWNGLNDIELEAVLVHEIEHLLRLHHERALEDKNIWNISADMLINKDIDGLSIDGIKIKLPEGAIYYDMAVKEGYKGAELTEALYYWLLEKRQEMKDKYGKCQTCGGTGKTKCEECGGSGQKECEECGGDGQGKKEGQGEGEKEGEGCSHCHGEGHEPCDHCGGKGDGKCPDCGGSGIQGGDLFDAIYGSKIDEHDIMNGNDSLSEATIDEIIESAKARGYGNISGDMIERLKELTKPPRINWKTQLRRLLSAFVFGYGENFENVWSKRNRRNKFLPGIKKLDNKVIIGIDTSGSIGQEEFQQFFAEIEKIIKEASQVILIQWDTEVKDVRQGYKRGDWRKVEIKGRGGTDVQATFNWVRENRYDSYLLVMLTDGQFGYNYDTHGIKTLWCVTEKCDPPGGKVIHIDINR